MRPTSILIFTFWLASMGWLTATKLLPPLRVGSPPRYEDILPSEAMRLPSVRWSIRLNERPIGFATNEILREADGRGSVSSRVTIRELSIDDLVSQRLGGFSTSILGGFGTQSVDSQPLSFLVKNDMAFDHFGQLTGFDCLVDVGELTDCITLRGTVIEDTLELVAYLKLPTSDNAEQLSQKSVYSGTIDLPPDSLVADSLSPRSRFGQLRVGQEWTFQTYRPLSPSSPMQTVEATVESRDEIEWNGESLSAFHVIYRRPATAVLSLNQELGHVWVRPDGVVIRQTMNWGSLTLTFERLPDSDSPASVAP